MEELYCSVVLHAVYVSPSGTRDRVSVMHILQSDLNKHDTFIQRPFYVLQLRAAAFIHEMTVLKGCWVSVVCSSREYVHG